MVEGFWWLSNAICPSILYTASFSLDWMTAVVLAPSLIMYHLKGNLPFLFQYNIVFRMHSLWSKLYCGLNIRKYYLTKKNVPLCKRLITSNGAYWFTKKKKRKENKTKKEIRFRKGLIERQKASVQRHS